MIKTFNNTVRWKVSKEKAGGDAFNRVNNHMSVTEWNKLVLNLKQYSTDWHGILLIKTHFSFIGKTIDFSGVTWKELDMVGCPAGRNQLYVYPNLSVLGCPLLESLPFANLHSDSFDQISSSNGLQNILNLNFPEKSKCAKCKYVLLCKGGCIGGALTQLGGLELGDPECPMVYPN
ncbi:hypothetical protein TI03_03600 [Achromatium sp. WMS1]|nr:hypothetical protein TI03_03600 [Achromatium sp. WMS1]